MKIRLIIIIYDKLPVFFKLDKNLHNTKWSSSVLINKIMDLVESNMIQQ